MPTAQKTKRVARKAPAKIAAEQVLEKTVIMKKVPAKKSPARKTSGAVVRVKRRSTCASCIAEASADKAFWVNNGPVVNTLDGLRDALSHMSDEQFEYHTKRAGNDFAKWVDEVLCHGSCATKLGSAKTRTGAIRAIATCTCD